jgi:threonine synthase
VRESGGEFGAVSDDEILEAQAILAAKGGVFAEPASCATLAGLIKLHRAKRLPKGATAVIILTGNGLKDPDAALSQTGKPTKIGGSIGDLMEALAL